MSALTVASPLLDEQRRHRIAIQAVGEARRQAQAGRIPCRDLLAPARSLRAPLSGPASHMRLELTEVRCSALTRGAGAMSDEITFGGAALLPDLTTRALGPFSLPPFPSEGEVRVFTPPIDVMTFGLGPSFAQGCVAVLQACENDGLGGPERIPELLEEVVGEVKAGVLAALGVSPTQRPRALPIIEEVGRVLELMRERPDGPSDLLDELFTGMGQDHAFFTHACVSTVIGSPAVPFPDGAAVGRVHEATFSRRGPMQKGAYTFRLQFAALSA